jgi:predicted nuclease with TOPRIM domain
MEQQTNHEIAQELAVLKAEMKAEMKGISTSIESIHKQLDSVVQMRDEITRMASNYENWKAEKETMWKRVDGLREDLESLREKELADLKRELNQWEGASKLARVFFGVLSGLFTASITYLFVALTDAKVMAEKVRVLEIHVQQLEQRGK